MDQNPADTDKGKIKNQNRTFLFSQRGGYSEVSRNIQRERIDDTLRNRLWNAFCACYWSLPKSTKRSKLPSGQYSIPYCAPNTSLQKLVRTLWDGFFKTPLDTLPSDWNQTYSTLRAGFFAFKWYEVYDFIEFIANQYDAGENASESDKNRNTSFAKKCNNILDAELSAYRFVGLRITEITSEQEIKAIEEALAVTSIHAPLEYAHIHLSNALEKMSDRTSPDYRTSIKESISAVESICQKIVNEEITLGKALDVIRNKPLLDISPIVISALDKLYGYTSSSDGIRHAMTDEPKVRFEDAKFMLVTCSGSVNYIASKAMRAGIAL